MGGKSSTTTQTTKLPPEIMAAYESLLNQATPVSQTAYQPYKGGVGGSGFEQNQLTGFNTIAGLQGASNGDFNAASNALASSITPSYSTVGNYMSPYISNVVNATMANMNEQNAEQQQGVIGNAAAQGALGGNRVGVAQAELARQQNLANQQTIAGLYNQGYNTALGAAQTDKGLAQQAASGYTNLGQTAMQTNLAQAAAQVGAGTQQQSWDYSQYQNALSYPFETTSWLANIVEGLGSGAGGTTSTQSPSGNTGSAVLGGILGLASLFNRGGVVGAESRPHRAQGGIIPYSNPSGIISANNNNPAAANDNGGYVPQVATAGIAPGRSTLPQGAPPQQQDQGQQMLQQGIKAEEGALKQKYPNGILAGQPAPQQGPTLSGAPLGASAPVTPDPSQSAGLLSSLGSFFGFADGGVARRGYDDGGEVDPSTLTPAQLIALLGPGTTPSGLEAPDAPSGVAMPKTDRLSPETNANFNDRFGPVTSPGVQPQGMDGLAAGLVPTPTPRPYVDPQVVTGATTPDAAPPLSPPVDVPVEKVAGVVPQPSGNGVAPAQQPSPRSYNVGNAQQMSGAFDKINDQYGLPPGYLNHVAYIESSFNPNANNGVSRGEFQFTNATAGQYGLKNPFDPMASADAAARLASDNAKFLANGLGRQPTAGELYLAHQQGAAGALNLITHPNAPATDIVGRSAVVGNGGNANMTAGQFANLWTGKFNGAPVPSGGGSGAAAPSETASSAPSGVAPSSSDQGSTGLSGLFNGKGFHLNDDQRMALLSAGLGMMAGTSPNFATNVGTGGLKGIESWRENQNLNRENALAASTIATNKGQLGLEGQRVDLAGKELALNAQRTASEIGLQTAQTANQQIEGQAKRYQVTPGPNGMLVRDVMNPGVPKLYTWDDIQKNGVPPEVTSNESVGAGVASGAQGAGSAAPSAPVTSSAPNNAPVTAAPTQPVAGPQSFVTKAPARPPMDGRLWVDGSKQQALQEGTDGLKQAREEYQGAASAQTQIEEMKHDMDGLGDSAWTAPGSGFQGRVQTAKTINTAMQALGFQPLIDPNLVAKGEDLTKISTRLGFDLSKTLGSREAADVVNQAVSAVPGGYNSKEGARRIIAGIEASNQRKLDYYTFLQDWAAKSGGSILGADDYFNKVNPPEKYANSALLDLAIVPNSQADIDNAPKGTMFNDNGILRIKK